MRVRRLLDRLRNRTAAFSHDLIMIPVAWLGAYWLRFNLSAVPELYLDQAYAVLPVLVVLQGGVFWYLGLYRGVWRFASIPDLVRILKSIIVGVGLSAVAIFFLTRMQDVPRSVFPLYAVLLAILLGGPRLLYRWLKEHHIYHAMGRRVLIVGAGSAGEMLTRELLRDPAYGYQPVGFVDDDPRKKGREIHGLRVFGYSKRIAQYVEQWGVELVLLAIPSATTAQMRQLVEHCEQAKVPMRTLPGLRDLMTGHSVVQALRDISIEDLLGREPVSLDWDLIKADIAGKVILVTGGGGSIGLELCRQLSAVGPRRLIVFDNSEFNLYNAERDLSPLMREGTLRAVLGDVCDGIAVCRVVREHQPEIVFHAAAYKHVPMLETQAREAVRSNVFGTRNVAQAAIEFRVGCFVLISTDKAVNPANAMGASKRVAELVCQDLNRGQKATRFITVRFGNVLDSAGSVVPLFRSQIAAGGPVTVTHPEVERYFMTIPEACQLIMESAAIGQGGEIFVLDMGEPVNIQYLAEQMILLAGRKPGDDVSIEIIGLRAGEKLSEDLFHGDESHSQTRHEKILLARAMDTNWEEFARALEELSEVCDRFDEQQVRVLLSALVPAYGRQIADQAAKVVPIEIANR